MGSFLILATSDSSWTANALEVTWKVLLVLIGVNMLIIVHEWGHFIVARMCGVKCEKFYIWFDIFGWKICKFKWGDTEYGFGVLPLGGYVKMLGQEDNPARLREELERAKAEQAAADQDDTDAGQTADRDEPDEIDIEAAEAALYDPTSYLAQSVPKRMAIISAGVIMNVVFAFVVAVIGYQMGVFEPDCGIGAISPGGAAWKANLKVGDRIKSISGKEVVRFRQLNDAMLGDDIDQGLPLIIERPGVDGPIDVKVVPDLRFIAPMIGITSPRVMTLVKEFPYVPGSAAALAEPKFLGGDVIVAVDGEPIDTHVQYHRQEAANPHKTLKITVERPAVASENGVLERSRRLTIAVPPRPYRRAGLVMELGPIAAVQSDSPADRAGLKPGDLISVIDGEPPGDPMTLADRLRNRANDEQPVTFGIVRTGESVAREVQVSLRRADWYETPILPFDHMSSPALGVAYEVTNRVAGVIDGSPAARAGLKGGETVVAVTFIPPDDETRRALGLDDDLKAKKKTVKLKPGKLTWSSIIHGSQDLPPGTRMELKLADNREIQLDIVEMPDSFNPDRGFVLQPQQTFVKATTFGQAVEWGAQETYESLTKVLQFLRKIGSQISPKAVGGPVTIVKMAYGSTSDGMGGLMMFLCLISANLAVINMLPIPVLDGGHMIFLAYEGIRGKPPSEKVHVGLSYIGLIFILTLMVWVLGLDFGLIPRL